MRLVIDFFIADPSVHRITHMNTSDLGDTPYPGSFHVSLFPGKENNMIQNG